MAFEALPFVIEEKDLPEVPAEFRAHYVKKDDGKLHYDAVPRKDLHAFLDSKRKAEAEAERTKKSVEGLDVEEARKALERVRELEKEELLKKGDVETLLTKERKKLEDLRAKERAEADEKYSAAQNQLERLLRDNAITTAAIDAGVLKDALDDVRLHAQAELSVKDGELVNAKGEKVDAGKWLKEKLGTKKHWLAPSQGGGTPPKGGGGAPVGKSKSQMSLKEKSEYVKQHGAEAYAKLK